MIVYELCNGVDSVCGTYQSALGSDERSVLPIHLVIESTCITQIMTCAISSPQRSRRRSTIHTFASFWHTIHIQERERERGWENKVNSLFVLTLFIAQTD